LRELRSGILELGLVMESDRQGNQDVATERVHRSARKARLREALDVVKDVRPGMPAYQKHAAAFMPLSVPLGIEAESEEPVVWCPGEENNGILLVTGASGSGKTEALKLIAGHIAEHGVPIVSVDFHGDVTVAGQTDVAISGGIYGQAGINPLALDQQSIARTGLRSKIERELDRIGRAVGKLSYKQKSCLSQVLAQAYRSRGINENDPGSWQRPAPVLGEVSSLLLYAIRDGMEGFEGSTLEACYQKVSLLADSPAFNHWRLLDVETMKAWNMRLDCSTLSRPAQLLAAETVLEMVFESERAKGPIPVDCSSDVDRFRVFVLVDEAKLLTLGRGDAGRSDHIVNILATEGRKYGIGLILASQVASHFGDEAHANAASRLVMKRIDAKEARKVAPTVGLAASAFEGLASPGEAYFKSASVGGLVDLLVNQSRFNK
jgi:hypothetical protein